MKKGRKEPASKKEIERIYIDSNIFIYGAIDNEEIGKKAKKILSEVKDGKYKAYTTTLTIDEFLWRVQKEVGRELALESVNIFFILANLELVSIDTKIIREAIEIYKIEKLDPRDAIHLATMREKKISVIISSDPDFDKIKEIKRIKLEEVNRANE